MIAFYLSMIETPEQRSLFEVMYYEYRDVMFAKARSILRDEHLAEDAVHTAFVRVANNMETINKLISDDDRAQVKKNKKINEICPKIGGYLVIVVKNVCMDILGKEKRSNTLYTDNDEFIESTGSMRADNISVEDQICSNESADRIKDAIKELSDTYRDTLYMHVVLEMDAKEIAETLSCSYETAKKRIQRGRSELQRLLRDNDKR